MQTFGINGTKVNIISFEFNKEKLITYFNIDDFSLVNITITHNNIIDDLTMLYDRL